MIKIKVKSGQDSNAALKKYAPREEQILLGLLLQVTFSNTFPPNVSPSSMPQAHAYMLDTAEGSERTVALEGFTNQCCPGIQSCTHSATYLRQNEKIEHYNKNFLL